MKDDKYIKVDDLFKDLADREEPIAAGSWSRMSSVLDKSLPVGGALGSGSRFTGYLLLALLTLGLGAGAVTWQYQSKAPSATNAQSIINENAEASATPSIANRNVSNSVSDAIDKNIDEPAVQTTPGQPALASAHLSASKYRSDKPTAASIPSAQKQMALAAKQSIEKQNEEKHTKNADPIKEENTSSALTLSTTTEAAPGAELAVNTQSDVPASPYEKMILDEQTNKLFVKQKSDNKWYKEVEQKGTAVYITKRKSLDTQTNQLSVFHDTIKREKYTRTILEPLSKSEMQRVRLLASAAPIAEARHYDLNATKAAVEEASSSNVALIPLSEFKVKSSVQKKSNIMMRFYDMMSKYVNGYQPYYFGLSFGGQTSFNRPAQYGYHFGMSAYYELRERWTLGLEAKMFYNKLMQPSITENYTSFTNLHDTVVNGTTMYAGTRQDLSNTYNTNGYWGFALPLTAQYHLGKVSLIAGIEPSYRAAIKHQAVLGNISEPGVPVIAPTALKATPSSINSQDFKSRFGLGYNVGLMYDWSKNWSADFRINQMLWHNVSGGSSLSNGLHKAPFFNLSLYYFIGRKDKVIYMMDNHQTKTR